MLSDGAGFTDVHGGVIRQDYNKREKSLYATDQTHILTFSVNYALPWGSGRSRQLSPVLNKIAGGWSVNAVGAYSSGFPLAISTPNTLPVFNGGLRPNLTGEPIRAAQGSGSFDPNRDFYLNKAAFALPGPLQFGNAPVYLPVRQPTFIQESFGVFKDTLIAERINLQFRTEISNPLNRVVFAAPIVDLSSAAFGKISGQGNSPRVIQFGLKLIF